jgi:hypothetical protein
VPAFSPSPSDKLDLFGEEFTVQEHPGALNMAYAQEGSRATTYKIRDQLGEDFALKVFKAQFRDPRQPQIATQLSRYKALQGLRAADRRVVPADDASSKNGLALAVVMPWIQGYTWFDLLNKPKRTDKCLRTEVAIHLCWRFLLALRALEDLFASHTDIASGNIIVDMESFEVQLIDLEEMHGPRFTQPAKTTRRTPGYTHNNLDLTDDGFWVREGDRLAGAILAAEMLALADPELAPMSHGDSFFDPASIGDARAPRFRQMVDYLQRLSPRFSQLFEQAWKAATLAACPMIADLADSIEPLAKAAPVPIGDPFIGRTEQISSAPPAGPSAPPTSSGVTWIPLPGLGAAPPTAAQGTRPIPTATQPIPASVAPLRPVDPALLEWLDLFMQDRPGTHVPLIPPLPSSHVTVARAPATPPSSPTAQPPSSPTAQPPTRPTGVRWPSSTAVRPPSSTAVSPQPPAAARPQNPAAPPAQGPKAGPPPSRAAAPVPASKVVPRASSPRARTQAATVDRFDVLFVPTSQPLTSSTTARSSEPVPDMAALKRSIAQPILFVALILGLMAIVVLFLRSLT